MKRILIFTFIILIGGLISFWGYRKNKDILNNSDLTIGTIKCIYNMTGDKNVPKVKGPVATIKIDYSYNVNGQEYTGWDVITKEDIQFGFPLNFQEGTKIQILYNRTDPSENKLKCKLKSKEDQVDINNIDSILRQQFH